MSPSYTLSKYFAVERSDFPASSGGRAWIKKPPPILRDLRNTLALQATESSRYSIEQGVPFDASSFFVPESPSSPESRRHHRRNGRYRVTPIALPVIPYTVPSLDLSGHTPVDALAFHVSDRDASAEEAIIFSNKRSSSMIISNSDHENPNVDNNSSLLGSKHAAIHHATKSFNPQSAPLNCPIVDQNALVFTIPPCSPTLPLSPPTASSSPISDLLSKRSGRMFRLVPTQNDRFMHAVATDLTDYHIECPLESHCSSSPTHIGFPPDMLALLQELDELASWVQDFPYPEAALGALDTFTIGSTVPVSCPHALRWLSNIQGDHFLQQPVLLDKGKRRMLTESTDDMSEVNQSAFLAFSRINLLGSASLIWPFYQPAHLWHGGDQSDTYTSLGAHHHSSSVVLPHLLHTPQKGTGVLLAKSSHLAHLPSPVSIQVPLSSEHVVAALYPMYHPRPWSLPLPA
ncbi:uncharacterized protein EDB93DRAFT_815517 [Suillus bovinus]|uniref:uncharacterized protein n=1 Tax=Suillus bovinus TaxID=48563 RepID=UPI001B882DA1|nr:uncharacterized protein EDB93DRAFT_815517 [Suillus bovinus]KAG2157785.1 hypothetical protein EDB93DRAFT_815517 [Suillus bovinus]